jgi:hypothetical protein
MTMRPNAGDSSLQTSKATPGKNSESIAQDSARDPEGSTTTGTAPPVREPLSLGELHRVVAALGCVLALAEDAGTCVAGDDPELAESFASLAAGVHDFADEIDARIIAAQERRDAEALKNIDRISELAAETLRLRQQLDAADLSNTRLRLSIGQLINTEADLRKQLSAENALRVAAQCRLAEVEQERDLYMARHSARVSAIASGVPGLGLPRDVHTREVIDGQAELPRARCMCCDAKLNDRGRCLNVACADFALISAVVTAKCDRCGADADEFTGPPGVLLCLPCGELAEVAS